MEPSKLIFNSLTQSATMRKGSTSGGSETLHLSWFNNNNKHPANVDNLISISICHCSKYCSVLCLMKKCSVLQIQIPLFSICVNTEEFALAFDMSVFIQFFFHMQLTAQTTPCNENKYKVQDIFHSATTMFLVNKCRCHWETTVDGKSESLSS